MQGGGGSFELWALRGCCARLFMPHSTFLARSALRAPRAASKALHGILLAPAQGRICHLASRRAKRKRNSRGGFWLSGNPAMGCDLGRASLCWARGAAQERPHGDGGISVGSASQAPGPRQELWPLETRSPTASSVTPPGCLRSRSRRRHFQSRAAALRC